MTREEALQEVARTTEFEFRDGMVVIRTVSLLTHVDGPGVPGRVDPVSGPPAPFRPAWT
jgi:hypothetical protein